MTFSVGTPPVHQATLPRIFLALAVGSLTGAFSFSILKLLLNRLGMSGGTWNGTASALVIDGIVLSVIYWVGLMLASPLWPVLHRTVFRRWWGAALLGATLTLAVWAALTGATMHDHAPLDMSDLYFPVAMAVSNALAGSVIWRIAYRQT
jgi:hypothetical protein